VPGICRRLRTSFSINVTGWGELVLFSNKFPVNSSRCYQVIFNGICLEPNNPVDDDDDENATIDDNVGGIIPIVKR